MSSTSLDLQRDLWLAGFHFGDGAARADFLWGLVIRRVWRGPCHTSSPCYFRGRVFLFGGRGWGPGSLSAYLDLQPRGKQVLTRGTTQIIGECFLPATSPDVTGSCKLLCKSELLKTKCRRYLKKTYQYLRDETEVRPLLVKINPCYLLVRSPLSWFLTFIYQ